MKHSVLLIALLLLHGQLFADESPSDSQRADKLRKTYATELKILNDYRKTPYDYSNGGKVLASAKKFFSEVNFVGLSKHSLESLLGLPFAQETRPDRFVEYRYGDGEAFVIRRFRFDARDLVASVEVIPGQ